MTLFHIPTAFLIVGLLYFVMPTVTWVVLSSRRSPAVALWCGGDISFGIGVILLGLRGHVPEWATFPLANLLMFIAVSMRIQSLSLDLAMPWRTMWMALAALLYVLGFEGIRRGLGDALLRLQYTQSIWVVMYGCMAVLAWRINHLERSRSARWIAGVLLLLVVAFVYSLIRLSIGLSPPDPLNSSPSNIFLALAGILAAVIGNIAYVGLAFDRSQRQTAEAERQYHAIIETTVDGFYSCDVDGRLTDINRAFCDMLGYTREELLCMKVHDVEAKETAVEMAEHVQHILKKGSDRFETRYRCKDGRLLNVELSVNFLPTNAVKFQIFTRDITERKRMEHELSDSEARYRSYFELPLTGRAVTSPSKGWLDVNATLCDMLGYTKAELTQMNWTELTHPDDLAADLALFKRAMDGEINGYTLEKRFIHKDGHNVHTHLAVHCLRKTDQSVDYFVALILDITEQKRAEQALRDSNARYDELVRRIPVGVYTLCLNADGEARFLYASEKFCQMLGLTEQEVLHDAESVHGFIHPDDRASLDESNRIAAQTFEPFRWEGRSQLRGETRWLRIESDSTALPNGDSLWNGVVIDITERKQAEASLRESEILLREAIEFSPIPLNIADNDGNILVVNRQFTENFGYTLDDIPTIDTWITRAYPNVDYRAEVLAQWNQDVVTALQNGTVTPKREYKVTSKNGTQFDVEITSKFLGNISVVSFNNVTERNQTERELRASREVLREMSRVAKVGGWNLNLKTNKLTWTEEVYRIREVDSNYQPQLEEGVNAYPPDARKVLRESIERAVTQGVSYDLELPFITAKGNHRWVRTIGNVEQSDGQVVRLYGVFQDITERKTNERQLLLTQFAMEQFADEVYIIRDDIHFQYVNDSACRMLEYGREELMTMTVLDIDPFFNNMAEAAACWQAIKDTGSISSVSLHRSRSGRVYPVEVHNNFIEYEGEGYVCSICHDITERTQAENEIKQLAFYDSLTQLPNRRLLLDRLHQAMVACVRSKLYGALLFIDLDNFKTLNDTLGHDQGDLLLQEVASRLATCVRECDTVARLGGDEFVVMLMGLDACPGEAAAQSQKIGTKILDKLNQKYQLTGHEHYCSASIGINLFDGHSFSVNELLKQADIALYQAKSDGRNTLRFFDPEMQSSMLARVALTHDLRHALAKNQFKLFCQSEVGHNQKIIGVEVLLRWQHSERGLIPPHDFIPLAEETGLIQSIGDWVLESACTFLKSWENNPVRQAMHLAVNISARQFHQANFVDGLLKIVRDTQIDPSKLMLELTESVVLTDLNDAVAKMNALKEIGLRFSLDDFGTGYSSLAYLTRLPFDQLKIDRSFVQNIGVKSSDAVIIQTIIVMANQLGIDVIAEGVETEAQRGFLYQQGCPVCQGYLFGKPIPLEDFSDSLLSA